MSSACFRASTSAVTSRAIVEAPMICPALSRMADVLTDTWMRRPSFL